MRGTMKPGLAAQRTGTLPTDSSNATKRAVTSSEVARPGEFTPTGQVTVLQAIALAGGFTRFAAPNKIIIVRKDTHGERRIPFAFASVVEDGDLRVNLPLMTNDTVIIP